MSQISRYVPKDSQPITSDTAPGAIVYYYDNTHHGRAWPTALAYSGKRSRPDWHISFQTPARREARTLDYFRQIAERAAVIARRKTERTQPHTCKIGDIFNFSWGYDQTNQDFYQVVAVTPGTVTVREITTRTHGSGGDMQRWVVPCPSHFTGDPQTKRPYMWNGKPCLRIKSYGSCQLWDGSPVYETSYA